MAIGDDERFFMTFRNLQMARYSALPEITRWRSKKIFSTPAEPIWVEIKSAGKNSLNAALMRLIDNRVQSVATAAL